jgi:hypothetical protein
MAKFLSWFAQGEASPSHSSFSLLHLSPPLQKEKDERAAVATTTDSNATSTTAIFYNVFIPTDQGTQEVQRTLSIVQEQMAQVGQSYANADANKNVVVYYTTIGLSTALSPTAMDLICATNQIRCVHKQHYDTGFEERTLQNLYDYCRDSSDTATASTRVIYMHNKGSYQWHAGINDKWRRHLTTAVTSQQCLEPSAAESCNVCGLLFHPMFLLIFPGNFFATDCPYVQKLIPPVNFAPKLAAVLQQRNALQEQNDAYRYIFPTNDTDVAKYASGRYAATHWIASHPAVEPCDLTDQDLKTWFVDRPTALRDFRWSLLPRNASARQDTIRSQQRNILGGNLFKWIELYNETPPANSWAWKWFPDGRKWKMAVDQFGVHAVHAAVTMETKLMNERTATAASDVSGED